MAPTGAVGITPLTAYFSVPSMGTIVAIILTLIFIWWAIFSVVAIYHLFRYARDSWMTVPAVALHLVVSGFIFLFMIGSFRP